MNLRAALTIIFLAPMAAFAQDDALTVNVNSDAGAIVSNPSSTTTSSPDDKKTFARGAAISAVAYKYPVLGQGMGVVTFVQGIKEFKDAKTVSDKYDAACDAAAGAAAIYFPASAPLIGGAVLVQKFARAVVVSSYAKKIAKNERIAFEIMKEATELKNQYAQSEFVSYESLRGRWQKTVDQLKDLDDHISGCQEIAPLDLETMELCHDLEMNRVPLMQDLYELSERIFHFKGRFYLNEINAENEKTLSEIKQSTENSIQASKTYEKEYQQKLHQAYMMLIEMKAKENLAQDLERKCLENLSYNFDQILQLDAAKDEDKQFREAYNRRQDYLSAGIDVLFQNSCSHYDETNGFGKMIVRKLGRYNEWKTDHASETHR